MACKQGAATCCFLVAAAALNSMHSWSASGQPVNAVSKMCPCGLPVCLSLLPCSGTTDARTHVHSGHDDIMPLLGDGPGGIAGPACCQVGSHSLLYCLFCSLLFELVEVACFIPGEGFFAVHLGLAMFEPCYCCYFLILVTVADQLQTVRWDSHRAAAKFNESEIHKTWCFCPQSS